MKERIFVAIPEPNGTTFINLMQIRRIEFGTDGTCRVVLGETDALNLYGPGAADFIRLIGKMTVALNGSPMHFDNDATTT